MAGLFASFFVACLFGVIKPYVNGAKRWHFAVAALIALLLLGMAGHPRRPSRRQDAAAGSGRSFLSAVPGGKPGMGYPASHLARL